MQPSANAEEKVALDHFHLRLIPTSHRSPCRRQRISESIIRRLGVLCTFGPFVFF
ncbi:hypothetical protein ZOSMA_164G00160 [Zostera marina]|uniref:Uncharacterized protein n=1 Tax=Zostera marina TaxID=29655 RepID=A0A0K9PTZ3_ZOSMR|nr:hypothetical protein ZOSMA_164G00160 [Zostera marina]